MTLMELLETLADPCHSQGMDYMQMEVEFRTAKRSNLTLLSVYVGGDDRVYIDIGDDDDD